MDEAEIMKLIPHVVRSSQKKVWIDYDEGADVLYINFAYPPNAVEHEEYENGIIRNYDETGKLTGLTIIAAKRFAKEAASHAEKRDGSGAVQVGEGISEQSS